jgi:predicted nucleic acid-binding protein
VNEVVLADTSAWIEFLRKTGSAANRRLRKLLAADLLATTDVVRFELLAGARDEAEWRRLRGLLSRCRFVPLNGPGDYEDAALVYRRLRGVGVTIASMVDCLVAVAAMKEGLELLHVDRDFDAIARHAPLRIAELGPA